MTTLRPKANSVDMPLERSNVAEETSAMPGNELDALLESAGAGCEGVTSALSGGEMDKLLDSSKPGFGFGKANMSAGDRPSKKAGQMNAGNEDDVGAAFDALTDGAGNDEGSVGSGFEPVAHPGPSNLRDLAPPPGFVASTTVRDSQPTTIDQTPQAFAHERSSAPFAHPELPPPFAPAELPQPFGHAELPQPFAHAPSHAPFMPVNPQEQSDEPRTVELQAWAEQAGPAVQSWDQVDGLNNPAHSVEPVGFIQHDNLHAGGSAPPPYTHPIDSFSQPFGASQPRPFDSKSSPKKGSEMTLALVAFGITVVLGLTAFLLLRKPNKQPTNEATAATAPAAQQRDTASADPGNMVRGEAEARAALRQLGEGAVTCARDIIQVLPGTAPAIPLSLRLMQDGTYTSVSADYRSPVYSCTKYRYNSPQPFQIQWQGVKGGTEGMAIVWLDTNDDAIADRALGMKATLVNKKEAELGDIEVLDPIPEVAATR